MSTSLQTLGIDRLTREQRIVLAQEIWDTIAAEPRVPVLSEASARNWRDESPRTTPIQMTSFHGKK
jgi:hypothetical protein